MERITQRNEHDTDYFYPQCMEICGGEGCSKKCNECTVEDSIVKKLGQYEDTGLTPEQVVEMDRLYREKCEELARLEGFALVAENDRLRRRNAELEIQVKKLQEELKAKENS